MTGRVVVVGAGVVGLSVAYYCAKAGFDVTVLEQGSPQRDSCSFGNAGMIVPSHFTPLAAPGAVRTALKWMTDSGAPFYLKPRLSWDLVAWALHFVRAANAAHVQRCAPVLRDLCLASRACFDALSSEFGDDFGMQRNGLLLLCKSAHMLDEEAGTARFARSMGLAADVLDVDATAAVQPELQMDIHGAVYYPGDAHLVPARFVAALERACIAKGIEICWNTPVTDWHSDNGRVVAAISGTQAFEADEFVLCAGVWAQNPARQLGVRIPIEAGKGYSLTLPNPVALPRMCSILTEARIGVTPMGSSLRFAGTMEIAGPDRSINQLRVQRIIDTVQRYYPDFTPDQFAGIEAWAGLRPCSADGMPYIGRTAARANLCIAAGHSMMGLTLAPITGKLIAETLAGDTPSIVSSTFSPDRFA